MHLEEEGETLDCAKMHTSTQSSVVQPPYNGWYVCSSDSCAAVLRVCAAWHPVQVLDPNFEDTECIFSLLTGRRQEAENLRFLCSNSVLSEQMGLFHTPISRNKESSHHDTGTANTARHLKHGPGHVKRSLVRLRNVSSPRLVIGSLDKEAFVDYYEMSMQLYLQHIFGPNAAGVIMPEWSSDPLRRLKGWHL